MEEPGRSPTSAPFPPHIFKNFSFDVLDVGWSQVSLFEAGALLFAAQIQYHYYLF